MTNYEIIKNMSVEEMAKFWVDLKKDIIIISNKIYEPNLERNKSFEMEIESRVEEAVTKFVIWLKSEV